MPGFRDFMLAVVRETERNEALDGMSAPLAGAIQIATKPDAIKNALSGTWLGHQLHPVLTDVPICAWSMASAIDLVGGDSGSEQARLLVGLGILASIPTAASGASDWSDTYGKSQRVGLVHALTNVSALAFQTTSWVVRGRGHRGAGVGLSAAAIGLVGLSSYLGGHLSYAQGVGVNHTAFQQTVGTWTDVAAVADLLPGKPLRAMAKDVPVVLVKHDEEIYALSATCVHAGGPLDGGEVLADGCIRCPWHASTFRLSDGAVVRGPASLNQPHWNVKVEDQRILVKSSGA
jgi:nitrite reductase/ring-hydroxylating ferredoxin subunit/uncharacterized membrane protein